MNTQLFTCIVNGITFSIDETERQTASGIVQRSVWAIGSDRGSKFFVLLGNAPLSKAEIVGRLEDKLTKKAS